MAEEKQKTTGLDININLDTTPILFTDNIVMSTNEDGVTLNVCQRIGNTPKLRVVTRVGMSREHAKKFIDRLGKLLALTEGQGQTAN